MGPPGLNGEAASEAADCPRIDSLSVVAAASLLVGLNQLIINIQPLLLGALARYNGLTDTQLGLISSSLVGGALCATSTAPFWVRKVNWRRFTSLSILAASAMLFAASRITSFEGLCFAFAAIGLLKGGIGMPSFACLGDTSAPERNFGTSVAVQSALAALAGFPMAAWLIPAYGAPGVLYGLILALMLGLVAARFIPAKGRPGTALTAEPGSSNVITITPSLLPFIAVMLAMMLFTIGVTSFWFFLERIGDARHVPAATIGLAVSGTALVTIPGSICVTWLSRWLNGLQFAVIGSLFIMAGYGLVALGGEALFLVGSLVFAFGWGIAQPGYWALARETDPTARLFVLSSAIAGFAAVMTGFIAGPVIVASGFDGLIAAAGAGIAAGAAMAALARRMAQGRRRMPAPVAT